MEVARKWGCLTVTKNSIVKGEVKVIYDRDMSSVEADGG